MCQSVPTWTGLIRERLAAGEAVDNEAGQDHRWFQSPHDVQVVTCIHCTLRSVVNLS